MGSKYEFWLTDDRGLKIKQLEKVSSFSYARSTQGLGTIQLAVPFEKYSKDVPSIFLPDWRIDVWRSPVSGIPARREGSFLLRRYEVYQRESDHVRIIQFYGRSPIDILRRQCWENVYKITGPLDNVMKNAVRAAFVNNPSASSTPPTTVQGSTYTYTGEFAVDVNSSDGPSISGKFFLKNVMDLCSDLRKASVALNLFNSANKKIFFDVIEDESLSIVPGGFGYRFRTYPTLRGSDRTGGISYSVENGNFSSPNYSEDYQDEATGVYKYNSTRLMANSQSADQYLSRWNFIKLDQSTTAKYASIAQTEAYRELKQRSVVKIMNGIFQNSPGSSIQPRSLYGVDWDLGDLLPVKFAGKTLNCEVAIVYIGVDDQGRETISGRTQVGA